MSTAKVKRIAAYSVICVCGEEVEGETGSLLWLEEDLERTKKTEGLITCSACAADIRIPKRLLG